MEAIWKENITLKKREQAVGCFEREIVVIGGGMTGLLTALELKRAGKKVVVLEAGRIAGGQTGHTTAKITSQHGLCYDRLFHRVGADEARCYWEANRAAIDEYRHLVEEYNIDCDFKCLSSYLYTTGDDSVLRNEEQALRSLGIPMKIVKSTELPFEVTRAICFEHQAQFHPLKWIAGFAGELEIYEESPVRRLEQVTCEPDEGQENAGQNGRIQTRVYTDRACVTAQAIVIATHYPVWNLPGFYFLRQHQERSYVVALEGCRELQGMYYSADVGGFSLRSAGPYLLLGGASHRTGKQRGEEYEILRKAAKAYFPKARIVGQWAAQDCMPHDGLPFIGRYSLCKKNWYVATGYHKWGMSFSMVAALLLTDYITGKENTWAELFSPQRLLVKAGIGNFLADVGESVVGLTAGWCWPGTKVVHRKQDESPNRQLESAKEQRMCLRCTHLGCKLNWNEEEASWDCPCHGSRYDENGILLDEPAQENLRRL